MQTHRMCNLASDFDECKFRKEPCSLEEGRRVTSLQGKSEHMARGVRNKVL